MFEIALSCGLLVAAGLMIKSVTNMRTMDPGYSTANVFTARIGFPAAYTDTVAEWRFFDQVARARCRAAGRAGGVDQLADCRRRAKGSAEPTSPSKARRISRTRIIRTRASCRSRRISSRRVKAPIVQGRVLHRWRSRRRAACA